MRYICFRVVCWVTKAPLHWPFSSHWEVQLEYAGRWACHQGIQCIGIVPGKGGQFVSQLFRKGIGVEA